MIVSRFRQPQFAFELVHFPLLASEAEENLSFSDLSGLLKLIASGHFAALFVFPPCSTWSRARRTGSPDPRPLRSRQHPLGLPSLPPEHQHVLASHNQALVFAIMCVEIAQQFCPAVSIIWVAPEDLGGHVQTVLHQSCNSGRQPSSRVVQVKWSVVSHILSSSALLITHDQLGFSRTFQDLFASCVKDGQCSIIEDLFYVTEVLCLSRVLAVPNTLPSLFQPEFWQFLLFQNICIQLSPVSGDLWTLDSYTSNPWIVSLASAPYSLRIEFQKLVSTMVRNSSSSTSSRGPIVVPGVHLGTGVPLFTGSRNWNASIIFAYVLLVRSSPSLSPSNKQLVFSTRRPAAHGCDADSSLSAC